MRKCHLRSKIVFLSVHEMNRQKSNLLLIFIFYIVCQVSIFIQVGWFSGYLNYTRHNGGLGTAKTPIPAFNVITIGNRRQTNISKQTTLLDGVDVGPPKQRLCLRALNRSVHEAMNNISNVKVHFKTRSGNVNIRT